MNTPMTTQEIMDMIERRAERRGERRAERRAERRGKLEGRRETILRQLQRKFGVLADDIVARVQNADATLLEQLEDKVLFANSIDEMFPS